MKDKWNLFVNPDELDLIAQDYRLARKLVSAKKLSPIMNPPQRVNWPEVVEYIKGTPALKQVLILDDAPKDGDKKVSLSTKKARKAFISLLNDDFLQSAMSQNLYVASHKKTVFDPKAPNTEHKTPSGD